jgi:hypothetical protein
LLRDDDVDWHQCCTRAVGVANEVRGVGGEAGARAGLDRQEQKVAVNILHRLTFARGSEALEFVRTLRELSEVQHRGGRLVGIGPVLVYGARILVPDTPAELYASFGALTLAHALGMDSASAERATKLSSSSELPADMALLFTGSSMPDVARGA